MYSSFLSKKRFQGCILYHPQTYIVAQAHTHTLQVSKEMEATTGFKYSSLPHNMWFILTLYMMFTKEHAQRYNMNYVLSICKKGYLNYFYLTQFFIQVPLLVILCLFPPRATHNFAVTVFLLPLNILLVVSLPSTILCI